MRRLFGIAVVIILIPISLALAVGIVFGIDRATNDGEILVNAEVRGIRLAGLNQIDAVTAVRAIEDSLLSAPIVATVSGTTFTIDPRSIDLDIDEAAIVDMAMAGGRGGSLREQFEWWVDNLREPDTLALDVPFTYDHNRLVALVALWDEEFRVEPTVGDLEYSNGKAFLENPRPGFALQVEVAADLIAATLLDASRPEVAIPARPIPAIVDRQDITSVIEEAEALVGGPVYLRSPRYGKEITVPEEVLRESIDLIRDDSTSPPTFRMRVFGRPIFDYIAERAPEMGTRSRDAEMIIDNVADTVTIIPSVPVMLPDLTTVVQATWNAARSDRRRGPLAYTLGPEAEISTADIEAIGIKEKLSEFTTFHACCESRVVNIQLIADAVDGAMVLPGEVWSLNEHVGERTREKGYVAAGAIIGGEVYCCDSPINIGGGTSQFTTTLYNAFFFGGFEDVTHMPHSIWFSRYPEGREATLGFPQPDLAFRNNTNGAVVIRTSHTDTSITAELFGDNGGIEVEAGLSNRYRFTGPVRRTEPNRDIAPCTEHIKQRGSGGWSIDIFRYITYPDGEQTTETSTWHYSGAYEIKEVHPTRGPGSQFCQDLENPDEGGGGG